MEAHSNLSGIPSRISSSPFSYFENPGKILLILVQNESLFPFFLFFQKADIVTGLVDGQAEKARTKDPKWMINGDWGVIQLCTQVQKL